MSQAPLFKQFLPVSCAECSGHAPPACPALVAPRAPPARRWKYRFPYNLSQAPLSKQFVPSTAFQTICPTVLCPMLRRRSCSMSRACGSSCSSSPAMEVPLSKQFVPSTAFQTICPRHRFSNNVSQAPLSKQCVPGTAFRQFVPSSAFQTICPRHTIRALYGCYKEC